jgi:hypothetical protein
LCTSQVLAGCCKLPRELLHLLLGSLPVLLRQIQLSLQLGGLGLGILESLELQLLLLSQVLQLPGLFSCRIACCCCFCQRLASRLMLLSQLSQGLQGRQQGGQQQQQQQ